MKKVLALAAFAFMSLAAASAHAQSTISPVPGAPDRPHETSPTINPADEVSGPKRSTGQQMADTRTTKMSAADRKEDRKEVKKRKKYVKTGKM